MNENIQQIAAEFSRFSRELTDLDKEWIGVVNQFMASETFDVAVAQSKYESYLSRFEDQRTLFNDIMQRLHDGVREIKKDKGSVPFSVQRLKSNLLKFNKERRVAHHLDHRIQSLNVLLKLAVVE